MQILISYLHAWYKKEFYTPESHTKEHMSDFLNFKYDKREFERLYYEQRVEYEIKESNNQENIYY